MRYYSSSKYSLPCAWETRYPAPRSQAAVNFLKVEGLRVKYTGPGEEDSQAATIRANFPVPPDCSLYYFEVEVLNKGQEGFIAVGFQTEDVILARLPGWEAHSYGYHGDDGCAFSGSGQGKKYGPSFSAGDTVGALLNRANRTIKFYKNGRDLGVAFSDVMDEKLFPCIGLRTRGEEVLVNFGAEPFVGDFEAMMAAFKEQVLANITGVPLPMLSSKGTSLLPQLIHDHLLHHRCCQTAAILARDLLQPQGTGSSEVDAVASDVAARQRIFELVVAGQPEEAVQQLVATYTRAPLDVNPGLDFRLKVAQFCEILRQGGEGALDAALGFARSTLVPHGPKAREDEELMAEAVTLLAYGNPEQSPGGHLLSMAMRTALAEDLNGAILAHRGLPAASSLERLYQQAAVTLTELKALNHPQASVLDVRRVCFGVHQRRSGGGV